MWSRAVKLHGILTKQRQLVREPLLMENFVPKSVQPEAFEDAMRNAKSDHLTKARAELE